MENNKAFTSKLDYLASSLKTGCGVSEAYDASFGGIHPAVYNMKQFGTQEQQEL